MLKVAILDDYQNVSQQFVDLEKLAGKYEIKIFSEQFEDEADVIDKLADFEALLVMRERTPITKNIIENLSKLKFIITSGLRNKSIDLDAAKKRKIIVSGTAEIEVDNKKTLLNENQSTYIPVCSTHRLSNPGKIPLELIEVQSGPYLGEDDITRFDDAYSRFLDK